MSKAILYDATLCVGCRLCEQACAERNKLPYDDTIASQETLSDHKLTTIVTRGDKFMRRLCMNCLDPACASVCPVGALRKTLDGPVTYDESRCMGCRYCMLACPFSVPKYEWGELLPRVRKCDMCADRVAAGRLTACAEACPTGATKFGDRDDLIAEAKDRIAKAPDQYLNRIYGIEEAGGTSTLLLSSVPFESFGLHTPSEPLPLLTYRVLSHIPDLVSMGGVLLGGVWWITHRREQVAAFEAKEPRAEGKKNKKEDGDPQ
jgi:formate dehydrogenase iron-sulfur subunit